MACATRETNDGAPNAGRRQAVEEETILDPREIFERDGFLIAPSLLSAAEAAEIKQEIERALRDACREAEEAGADPDSLARGGVYVGLAARSAACARLARHPRILDILADAFAPDLEFLSDKVVYKGRGTSFGTPWHQDWPYWGGAHKVSVWLALDDATMENGCMKLLPGSHHAAAPHDGEAPAGEAFGRRLRPDAVEETAAVAAAVPAGGAVFFHDLTLHASYPNAAGVDRWAWIGTYRDAAQEDQDYEWAVAAALVRGGRRRAPR